VYPALPRRFVPAARRPPPAARVSVLVVDDHAVVREALSMYIEAEPGITVWGTAASGDDALDQLRRASPLPGALIVDVQMPGMTGIELVAEVAARHPGLPCVVFSADPEAQASRRALAAGAAAYVEKGRPERVAAAVLAAVAPG
jgi:DNA-binding NarL/FixJ family response regulator